MKTYVSTKPNAVSQMNKINKITRLVYFFFFLLLGVFYTNAQVNTNEVPFSPRSLDAAGGSYINIKGDYTFLSNSVMNPIFTNDASDVNNPYNVVTGTSNSNNSNHIEYINVDNGNDPTIFSSSSSTLTLPDCSRIYYAGLYWAGNYDQERRNYYWWNYNNSFPVNNQRLDYSSIKFKVPGGNYIDLQADINTDPVGEEDDIIIDGYNASNPNNPHTSNHPYVCYKNVTNELQALADPSGEYTVANVRGTRGATPWGAAGWTLVIVYENPTLSGKYISVFDGYEGITSNPGDDTAPINIVGFETIPNGNVKARLGVSALEGESYLDDDVFQIQSNSSGSLAPISNAANPTDNFFNSTISNDGSNVALRSPNGLNSMGYDSDVFNLENTNNAFIDNGDTSARLELGTNGDWFAAFLVAFGVEIIEPDIVLEKKVREFGTDVDITGQGVNLGDDLIYELSFKNIGNDDATNYTIRDILPINTSFIDLDINDELNINYTYDANTREIIFTIPDNLVEVQGPTYSIRMHVRVAENCFDFIDACTDLIQNLAYSTYEGVENPNQISDDPSVTDFNDCGFVTPGASNFLLDDLSDCNFVRTAQLCGDNIVLNAGDNFDDYIWYLDENNNNEIDATDTVINDGNPDNDLSTLLVDDIGTYIVDKIVADPCKGFKEIIVVERFGETQTNPIVEYFNSVNGDADLSNDIQGEIVPDCNTGTIPYPRLFLCGANDSQLLQMNIADAQSLTWQLLDETSCPQLADDCINTNLACTWNDVATGSDYTADTAGKYRLVITYQNGCFSRFYFDVYQNNLDFDISDSDIFCTTPGNITVTGLGGGYGYQLVNLTTNNIDVPFSANNGSSFSITNGGAYRVDITQLDNTTNQPIVGGCIFETELVEILDRDIQVDLTPTAANCNNLGEINIQANNVRGDYNYYIYLADGTPPPASGSPDYYPGHPGGTLVDDETAQPSNNFTFAGLNPYHTTNNPYDYNVVTRTGDGCLDVQTIRVTRDPDPTLSAVTTQNIGCTAGVIELTPGGGPTSTSYTYAIWSKDGSGTDLYTSVADIPASAYQASPIFTFGWHQTTDNDGNITNTYTPGEEGDYIFVVFDSNNCPAYSSITPMLDNGTMSITSINEVQPSCSGDTNGSLTINISGGVAPFEYSIDGGTTTQSSSTFAGLTAGSYSINVTDNSGCEENQVYVLSEPTPFSASAGVSVDVTCNPTTGAEVRFTNVVGGTPPYSFSFDGGANFGPSQTATLLPGTHSLIARDASCDFPLTVEVPDLPQTPIVTLTPMVDYNCDGTGNIVVTPDITTYNYTYELDGVLNSPDPTSNTFTNLPVDDYVITTNYISQTPPTAAVLLNEDFGSGPTIASVNTTGYAYEDQTGNPPGDSNSNINDLEHAVTSSIVAPFGAWLNPVDHTTGTNATNGRYLAINVGSPGVGIAIYTKPINDIIPNQPLSISLHIINLLRSTHTGQVDPNFTIELRHPTTDALIASALTGIVPRNDLWNEYILNLDPGTNTSLNLVIVTNQSNNNGNDAAIDDIIVTQTPEVCELSIDTPVSIEPGNAFTATATGSTDVSCNGLSDGTITFEVENFDATAGFEYSVDGGTTYINSTTSPVTTAAVFGAGTQTILIRRSDDTSCDTSISRDINEPSILTSDGNVTTELTCDVNATITANATGGVGPYFYQLQDAVTNNPIAGYDFATNTTNTVFNNLIAGSYEVVVRDRNGTGNCPAISLPINISAVTNPSFTVTPTVCYSGNSDGEIVVVASGGNGEYQFKINDADGNPWLSPNPATPNTYTFTNLSNGTYTIDVQDSNGCDAPQAINININPALSISASAQNITACGTATNVDITASGGDGNLVFAYAPTGNTPANGDFASTNPINITGAGTYDIYVRDNNNNGGSGGTAGTDFCEAIYTITIVQDAAISVTPTPTDVTCFGDTTGAIAIGTVTGGEGPFEFSINNGATYQLTPDFNNLPAGNYTVQIRDANLCTLVTAIPITINQPNALSADTPVLTQNYLCGPQLGEITVTNPSGGSGNYQYSINGGSWTASTTGGTTFTNLTDGTFSIDMRDANDVTCTTNIGSITIDPLPTPPVLADAITYNCDGTGNVTITPFDASYTYTLGALPSQTGAGANVFTNVPVGTHTLTVDYGRNCSTSIDIDVLDGNAFNASITSFTNPTCNTDSDGTITLAVENFGTAFQYSIDGGTNYSAVFNSSPQTITGLADGTTNIIVRYGNNLVTGCTIPLSQVLTEPAVVVANASITEPLTCNNIATGATITASATGGTPDYEYQLEDNAGGIIHAYSAATNGNTTIFTGLGAGSYIVRTRDRNNCDDAIDTALVISTPTNPTFTVDATNCYSGLNDGSIFVNVTSLPGNGDFQFRIGPGAWVTPGTTSHTFTNLAEGSYTIEVRDGFGCSATLPATINPQLTATINAVDISSCADGSITVNATGGNTNYAYAYMPTGNIPAFGDFVASNTFTVTTGNHGDYDVYVRDNDAIAPDACNFMETVTVGPAVTLTYTSTPTDPICHDGTGSIQVNITAGDSPYTIQIVDLDNGGAANQTNTNVVATTQTYYNLTPGNYTINVTDANGCLISDTPINVANPDELIADIEGIAPVNCDPDPNQYGFRFINYPITIGTLEFSADGGSSWQSSDTFVGAAYTSGTEVNPVIRTVSGTTELCRTELTRYTIPYPLDDLDISISAIVVDCNDLQVTVQGTEGLAPYEYTYAEDPVNFDPAAAIWQPGGTIDSGGNTVTAGHGSFVFPGLVPGRTYVFYVRDASPCVRQSSQNVNTLAPPPVQINADVTPTCDGVTNGQITYTVTETTLGELGGSFDWDFYRLDDVLPIGAPTLISSGTEATFTSGDSFTVPTPASLGTGDYYVEIRGAAPNNCVIGSENVEIEQLNPITFTPNILTHITCANPGLIEIQNPQGGGGTYTYTLSSANFVSDIVSTDNPIEVPMANLVDPTATPFNILVEIADQYNCPVTTLPSHTVSMNISQSPTITSVTTTNCASPFGITVNASGGTAPYLYSNDGGTTYIDNGGIFNNVAVGTYNISIIDANGCTDTDTIEIYPALEANVQTTKLLDCDVTSPEALITIEALNGSGSYDYAITNTAGAPAVAKTGFPSNPFNYQAPLAGDYTITIYDNNTPNSVACNREFTVTIDPEITPILAIDPALVNNETCEDSDDGAFTVTATHNGTGPFTFEITHVDAVLLGTPIAATTANGYTATFNGLTGTTTGTTYTVTGTSTTNSCSETIDQIITEPLPITVPLANIDVVEFGCAVGNNVNNASITINLTVTGPPVSNVTGGSGNYVRYRFVNTGTGTTVQDGPNATYIETNPLGGNYDIFVHDDNDCSNPIATNVDIQPFDELLTVTAAHTISCNPVPDGEVTISVTSTQNDATQFEYSINGGTTWQNTGNTTNPNIFSGLNIGTHNFIVRHVVTGCEIPVSETINDPNTFEINVTNTTEVICEGSATGTVTFTVTDPIGGYAGTYSWNIFDTNGTPADPSDDGLAIDSGTSASFNSTILPAGEYRLAVSQDGLPTCPNETFFSIAGPDSPISVSPTFVSPITCIGNDGIIEIVGASGGWGGYQYYISTTPNPDPNDPANYNANFRLENLSPGVYDLWIIDSNGCPFEITDVTLTDPTPISADLQLNQQNCTNFEGEIEVINEANGQGSNYSYLLQRFDGSSFVDFRPIQTNDVFTGLGAGEYRVIVSDQWSCSNPTTNTITLYEPVVPQLTYVKPIDCNSGGTIDVSQTGGAGGTYTYSVVYPDGSTPDPSNNTGVFTGLNQVTTASTFYTFTITDDITGCSKTINGTLEDIVYPVITIDNVTNVTCNTLNNGSITVSTANNGIDPYNFTITDIDGVATTINPTSSTATTATFTGLAPTSGVGYTVTLSANNGCTDAVDIPITEPLAINVTAPTPVSFNCTTGNITDYPTIVISSVSGGSLNYIRYEFINTSTGITVQDGASNTYTETNYAGGNYTINVYDDNDCVGSTNTSIPAFDELLTATPVPTSILCGGTDIRIDAVGSITNSTANLANYEFREITNPVSTFQASNIFTGLAIGVHRFETRNIATGCIIQSEYIVNDPNTFDVFTNPTNVICNGDDGQVTLEITDAVYTGTFDWEIFNTNNTQANLLDDISEAAGTGIAANTTTAPIALPAGNYRVRISQANNPGCTLDRFFSITEPEVIMPNAAEQSNPTCSDDQGSILVNPSGGVGPFTITLSNGTGYSNTQTNVSAYLFEGLSGGTYDVTITDTIGCSQPFASVVILQTPEAIDASAIQGTLDCFDENTASITASVVPRTFPVNPIYQYQLNTYDATGTTIVLTSVPQANNTFSNLIAGTYSITVTDDFGCSDTTLTETIVNPIEVTAQLVRTQALTCTNGVEMHLTASGGTGPYEYFNTQTNTWLPMGGGSGRSVSFPNADYTGPIPAGTYQFMVRDVNNCESQLSNEITEDPIENLVLIIESSTTTLISCNGNNSAAIFASADGGLGNYMFELFENSVAPANRIAGPQPQGIFRDLPAGTYFVNVISEDCTTAPEQVIITEPTPLDYTDEVIDVTCNGEEDGSITVTLSGGLGNYQYAISPNLNKFESENTFTDLAPGDYTVIAQDGNGGTCFYELEYTITEPNTLEVSGVPTQETCQGDEDGTITLTINGGTAPFRSSINSNDEADFIQDRLLFENLSTGNHIIIVRDVNDCEASTVITVEPGVNLNATVIPVYECTGDTPNNYINVTLEDDSVLGNVMYALDSEDLDDMVLVPDFRNISPGDHYVTIVSTETGCSLPHTFFIENYEPLTLSLTQGHINQIVATVEGGKEGYTFYFDGNENGNDNTYIITQKDTPIFDYEVRVVDENGCEVIDFIEMEFIDIEIPEFFTPNGDGENDKWAPQNREAFPEILTIIFDRYGREVYRIEGVDDEGWDGFYNSTELPSGDYWYVIKLRGERDSREFVGNFTLYR